MKNIFSTLMLSAALCLGTQFSQAQTTEIEDVQFPNTFTAGSHSVTLNGGGVREKMWIDLYVGALYLPEKSSDAASIMDANEPQVIRLHIVSTLITSEKMVEAVEEGFDNSTGGKKADLRTEIDNFIAAFKDEIKENDIYEIIYTPEKGTEVYKNGSLKGTIAGLKFKKALFGIWLGEDPADDDVKEGMLGLD